MQCIDDLFLMRPAGLDGAGTRAPRGDIRASGAGKRVLQRFRGTQLRHGLQASNDLAHAAVYPKVKARHSPCRPCYGDRATALGGPLDVGGSLCIAWEFCSGPFSEWLGGWEGSGGAQSTGEFCSRFPRQRELLWWVRGLQGVRWETSQRRACAPPERAPCAALAARASARQRPAAAEGTPNE